MLEDDWIYREIVKPAHDSALVSTEDVVKVLVNETDRGCAIFSACILDDELRKLLQSLFRSEGLEGKDGDLIDGLFVANGPLANFSARIKVAFALGMITRKMRRHLDLIRRVRNAFAHTSGALDFEDPKYHHLWSLIAKEWKPVLPHDANGKVEPNAKKIGFVFAVQSIANEIRVIRVLIEHLEEVRQFKSLIPRLEKEGR